MPNAKQPNFLIFITDQFNPRYLGYAGHPLASTPNIDRLAASGMNFSRTYTPQPLCMPARASMFTGLTPRGHRVRMNGIPLDPTIPTFTEALRQSGYRTHCCGKIHLHNSAPPKGVPLENVNAADYPECRPLWLDGTIQDLPLPYYGLDGVDYANGHGHNSYGHYVNWLEREHPKEANLFFDQTPLEQPSPAYNLFNRSSYKWALSHELHPMTWVADRTIDFLNTATSDESPFMLMCSIQEPHPPFAPPAPYCYHFDPKDIEPPIGQPEEYDTLPPHFRKMYETAIRTSGNHSQAMSATEPYRTECIAHYLGLIEMLDHQLGRVMDALHKSGLDENTVVMFTADHGDAMGDHGMWGKGPYHFDGVIRVPFLVSWPGHITPGATHEGVISLLDFAPTILDIAGIPIPEGDIPAESEAPDAPHAWPGRSLLPILTGEDTPIDGTALVEMDEDYLGFKIRTLVTRTHRFTVYSGQSYGELFDLENDPDEINNLWNDPTHRRMRDDLHIQLLHKIMETDISLPRQISRA
jgi:arylsulfatase A-like enzyme